MTKSKTIKAYTLANGDTRYMFKLYASVNPLTGKELHTTRRGFKTKKEANVALAALKADIHNGTYKKRLTKHIRTFMICGLVRMKILYGTALFLKQNEFSKIIFYL